MESSSQAVSPLRQRMIEDMRLRKQGPKTQSQRDHRWFEFLLQYRVGP